MTIWVPRLAHRSVPKWIKNVPNGASIYILCIRRQIEKCSEPTPKNRVTTDICSSHFWNKWTAKCSAFVQFPCYIIWPERGPGRISRMHCWIDISVRAFFAFLVHYFASWSELWRPMQYACITLFEWTVAIFSRIEATISMQSSKSNYH